MTNVQIPRRRNRTTAEGATRGRAYATPTTVDDSASFSDSEAYSSVSTPKKKDRRPGTPSNRPKYRQDAPSFATEIYYPVLGKLFWFVRNLFIPSLAIFIAVLIIAAFFWTLSLLLGSWFSPLARLPCILPIAALRPAACDFFSTASAARATDFQQIQRMVDVHSELDRIQEMAAGGISMPMFIQRSESAIREIKKRVQLSHLPSKNELAPIFEEFCDVAEKAGEGVEDYFASLERVHETAIHLGSTTERRLDALESSRSADSFSLIPMGVKQWLGLVPSIDPRVQIQAEWLAHLQHLQDAVDRLLVENKVAAKDLKTLERLLWQIHDFSLEDKTELKAKDRELRPGYIDTALRHIFKGHEYAVAVQTVGESLKTVDEMITHRNNAFAMISGSALSLRGLSKELKSLKERITEKQVVSEDQVAGIGYQLDMIRGSVSRMKEKSQKWKNAKQEYHADIRRQLHGSL